MAIGTWPGLGLQRASHQLMCAAAREALERNSKRLLFILRLLEKHLAGMLVSGWDVRATLLGFHSSVEDSERAEKQVMEALECVRQAIEHLQKHEPLTEDLRQKLREAIKKIWPR